jgi:hypothetical protein
MRMSAAIGATAAVQFLLLIALLHHLKAPVVDRPSERERRLTLFSLSSADQDEPEPKQLSRTSSLPAAPASPAPPTKIESPAPEWRAVTMKIANVTVAPAASAPGSAGAAAAQMPAGGGAWGYDPYAGASLARPGAGPGAMGAVQRDSATVDEKAVAALKARLLKLAKTHGQASFMLTMGPDGSVGRARYVSGTIEPSLRQRAERALVGSRPYTSPSLLVGEILLGPMLF